LNSDTPPECKEACAYCQFIGKRVRKYYTLSPSGKLKTKEKVNELADFMNTMKFLLDIKTKTS
jgi:hypothetical protein